MKKIWIVDDDEEMIQAVQLMLKLLNCDVTGHLNARLAAQALLAGGQPDLMLLDINMPEVSGLDMLEFLRKSDEVLDRFLKGRGGILQDDLLSIEIEEVRQLLNREFPELVAQFGLSDRTKKVIKRRAGEVDLSPLRTLDKKP